MASMDGVPADAFKTADRPELDARTAARTREMLEAFSPATTSRYAEEERAREAALPVGAQRARSMIERHARDAEGSASSPFSRSAQSFPIGFAGGGNAAGGTHYSVQRPYDPATASPERQWMPTQRKTMNREAAMFYRLDPVIGPVIDMLADLPFGRFTLSGESVEGSVKAAMETSCHETQVEGKMPMMERERQVKGEAIPHLYWSEEKGHWTHLALHDPDDIDVLYAPLLPMEPILEFAPTHRLREIITNQNPLMQAVRASMPTELVDRICSGQKLTLAPTNATLLARRMHDYDVRGTSIIQRLWRILAYEDAVFNCAIATARRCSCFVAGTPILTVAGIKNVEDVTPGEKIIAGNGSVETIEGCWAQQPDGEGIIEIKAVGTQTLQCTPNHRFKVWSRPVTCACGCNEALDKVYTHADKQPRARKSSYIAGHHLNCFRNEKGQMTAGASTGWIEWSDQPRLRTPDWHEPIQTKEAKDLRQGDYFLIPRKFEEVTTTVTAEAARVLGYFVAEGSRKIIRDESEGITTTTFTGVSFTFSLAESETWAPDVAHCAKIAADADARINRYVPGPHTKHAQSGREGRTTVSINRKKDLPFTCWLAESGGLGANHHLLSEEVMRWPLALKQEFIRGYYRGDGHWGLVDGCPQVCAGTTSKSLAYQVRLVLAQLGYFASISPNPRNQPGQENWADNWVISTTGRDARALVDLIWGIEIEAPETTTNCTWSDENWVYVPIQKVQHKAVDVVTYNLSVTGDKSYISAGIYSHNSPIKVAKIGDPASNFMPSPQQRDDMLRMLQQTELDPMAWIVTHFGVSFELVGVQERVLPITQHYPLIEQVKLSALGVSKAFTSGETSYQAAAAGLTILLRRLFAVRQKMVSDWLLPKFFGLMAIANQWTKSTPAELAHGVRIKRTAKQMLDEGRYIIPEIIWEKSLDPNVESERIAAMSQIDGLTRGKISRSTQLSAVGLDAKKERAKQIEEAEEDLSLLKTRPEVAQYLGIAPGGGGDDGAGGAGGAGGGGGMMAPAMPSDAFGGAAGGDGAGGGGDEMALPPEGGGEAAPATPDVAPAGASGVAPAGAQAGGANAKAPAKPAPVKSSPASPQPHDMLDGGWQRSLIEAGQRVMSTFDADEARDIEPWDQILGDRTVLAALQTQDRETLWGAIEDYLIDRGYPARSVLALQRYLRQQPGKFASRTKNGALLLDREALILDEVADRLDVNDRDDLYSGL